MVFRRSLTTVGALLSVSSATPLQKRDYPPAGACEGVCEGRLHDPAVIYNEATSEYWRFTTNDGIGMAVAPSISGPWTYRGAALPNGSSIDLPGNRDLWAPDVLKHKDIYYLYYSVSEMGSSNSDIGVAASGSLDAGEWVDYGSIGIPQSPYYNRIDGNLFTHDPDNLAMSFGSFWDNIFQLPMEDPPIRVVDHGKIRHLAMNNTVRGQGLVDRAQEGPYLFFWQGWHYLFVSAGNCCNEADDLAPPGEEYHIMVCRSKEQWGNFVDKEGRDCFTGGTMVLNSHGDVYAPGGQGVMWDPNLQSVVMYYHYVRPSVSYDYDRFYFGWNKLDFSSGWPVVIE
ncbi:Putative glycoside hydrolase, family 43 [Septoria linicola]|uniref:Arabinan endo-1,5-alpha-L-arabinosidase n=1 Tax=Septoria linicola TaxID=215465 RepID=A0A9Q9AXJ1_9PEZI|nr:putative glycoside hydrolase, family 43 [Septoria linicola]USW55028.1 Putative glycoside hydrolase, family 43 [Septoria linicola]